MRVFITGGTGYLGQPLISELIERGHSVRALARPGSEGRLPAGCEVVTGDPLRAETFARGVAPADTFVQLVGVPRPSPAKAAQFRAVDRVSALASIAAAGTAAVGHFVYVSVAHPAPVMRAYVEVRKECEERLRASGLGVTIVRPWYVLGRGHRWPYALVPAYALCERIPRYRGSALRLGLVTHRQMIRALVAAVESPVAGVRILEVPQIRAWGERLGPPAQAVRRAS